MKRRTFIAAGGGALVLGGGYLGYELFAPEQPTRVNQDRAAADGVTVVKSGSFTGKDGHTCSGTVLLARDEAGPFLQFRDYEQTQGPDVFCYLTPGPDPDTNAEISSGWKVLIDGGADGGEMTKVGTFSQSLPADVVPTETSLEDARGVGIWCSDFRVPFGAATLSDA